MKTSLLLISFFLFCFLGLAQYKPIIMLIPYTQSGENIQTTLDKDAYKRAAIAKINDFLETQGFHTIDFFAKLKIAKETQAFTSDNQHNIKTEIITGSGCDIYITVDIDAQNGSSGAFVQINLSATDAYTGENLVIKSANSGKYYTEDMSRLANKAIDMIMLDFSKELQINFDKVAQNGKSIYVEISLSKLSSTNFSTEIASQGIPLSDVIESWMISNSFKGNYHINGITNEKMIIDELKIPFSDEKGNSYTCNQFALSFYQFLKKLDLNPIKEQKGNAIFITLE